MKIKQISVEFFSSTLVNETSRDFYVYFCLYRCIFLRIPMYMNRSKWINIEIKQNITK